MPILNKFNEGSEPRWRAKESWETGGRALGFFFWGGTPFSFYIKRKWGNKLDAVGRVTSQGQSSFAAAIESTKFQLQSSSKNPTVTEYDASGRVKKVIEPTVDGVTVFTETIYNDPFEVTVRHSGGRSKKTTTNTRGQILYVEDLGDKGQGAGNMVQAKMGFCYDLAGRRVKKMDTNTTAMSCNVPVSLFNLNGKDISGNNIVAWQYDGFGQLKAMSDPDLNVTHYNYNNFGELVSQTDSLNRSTSYQYDNLGRITLKNLPSGEGSVFYIYDFLTGADNALGRLVSVEDKVHKTMLSYNKMGKHKSQRRVIKEESLTAEYITRFKYDLLDRTTIVEYPQNSQVSSYFQVCYQYNKAGLIKSVSGNFSQSNSCSDKILISQIHYDDLLRTTSIDRGNGSVTNYTYDVRSRIVRGKTDVGASATLQDMQYSYNLQDNIEQINNTMNFALGSHNGNLSSIYNYEYDGLDRLNDASGITNGTSTITGPANKFYRHKFAYSANGNINEKQIVNSSGGQIQKYSYNYTNHQATSIANASSVTRWALQYDAVGNMTSRVDNQQNDSQSMAYNAYNKITRVYDKNNNLAGEYQYADGGYRVYKKQYRSGKIEFSGGETILQQWEATIEEIVSPNHYTTIEKKDNIVAQVYNVYLNNIRIAGVLPDETSRHFLSDQVNSTRLILNDNGEPVKYIEYTAYGEEFINEGEEKHLAVFGSHQKDSESGFYHMSARHYDSEIGRFTQADIIIDGEYDTQGWNRYMYVGGMVTKKFDPTGRFLKHDDITREGAEMAGYDQVTVNELVKANTFRDTKDNIPIVKTFAYQNINHFDGLKNFADIEKVFKEKLIQVKDRSNKKSGEALHAIQDLYSHSNYTQLAKREFGDILVAPTFKQVLENKDKYSKFYQMLKKNCIQEILVLKKKKNQ